MLQTRVIFNAQKQQDRTRTQPHIYTHSYAAAKTADADAFITALLWPPTTTATAISRTRTRTNERRKKPPQQQTIELANVSCVVWFAFVWSRGECSDAAGQTTLNSRRRRALGVIDFRLWARRRRALTFYTFIHTAHSGTVCMEC